MFSIMEFFWQKTVDGTEAACVRHSKSVDLYVCFLARCPAATDKALLLVVISQRGCLRRGEESEIMIHRTRFVIYIFSIYTSLRSQWAHYVEYLALYIYIYIYIYIPEFFTAIFLTVGFKLSGTDFLYKLQIIIKLNQIFKSLVYLRTINNRQMITFYIII